MKRASDTSADYDSDVLAWSERQAAALRQLASRRDLPNELDLEHVAEEIEDVGRSQLIAVQSFLRQIFIHLIKTASLRDAPSEGHWHNEVVNFRSELLDRFTPSMAQRIALSTIWKRAIKDAGVTLAAQKQRIISNLPSECPFELEDMLDEEFDFLHAVEKLV